MIFNAGFYFCSFLNVSSDKKIEFKNVEISGIKFYALFQKPDCKQKISPHLAMQAVNNSPSFDGYL